MTYLLDTTTFSLLMRRSPSVRARLEAMAPGECIAICAITRGEVLYGVARLESGRRKDALAAEAAHQFAQLPCVAVPEAAADHYARLKRVAELKGTPLDENDLWIAATACLLDAVLVTSDHDFQSIPSLRLEDWAK